GQRGGGGRLPRRAAALHRHRRRGGRRARPLDGGRTPRPRRSPIRRSAGTGAGQTTYRGIAPLIDTLQMIFFTLLALGVLVTIHEFGHFWVARRCGVKVLRFSIGFGAPLLRWHDRRGTEYVIAALPLGGYVKMLDERESPVAEAERGQAFNTKTVWQRMAVVVAGPLANFLLAVAAFWVVYLLGVQGVAPVVGSVVEGSVADRARLEPGQEIVAVDGEPTPTWQALGEQLLHRIGEEGTILFTVKYPDSSLEYHTEADLQGWQVDADRPDPIASIGIDLFRPEILPVADEVVK